MSSTPDTQAAADTAPTSQRSRTALWLVLLAVIIADALDMMDATLTNIAAPVMARELGGGELFLKWLGSAYTLAMGVLLVVGGRLGDRFGQRRMFLLGMTGFTIASLLCGVAPTPEIVIVGRLLQGGFGALMIPQGMAIMARTFPRDFMRTAFSAFGPVLGLAVIAGPLLGALIVHLDIAGLSWRPIFLINVVLGTAGLILATARLPQVPADAAVSIDATGAGLLAAAMAGVVFALIEGPSNGWLPWPALCLAGGLACLAGFAYRQIHEEQPLILPSLFHNRGFTAGLVLGLAFFSVVSGFAYVVSLYLQQGLHYSVITTALVGVAPMSVGIIVAAVVAAPLIARLGRRLILLGLSVNLVGVLSLWAVIARTQGDPLPWAFVLPGLVIGVGMGACFG